MKNTRTEARLTALAELNNALAALRQDNIPAALTAADQATAALETLEWESERKYV